MSKYNGLEFTCLSIFQYVGYHQHVSWMAFPYGHEERDGMRLVNFTPLTVTLLLACLLQPGGGPGRSGAESEPTSPPALQALQEDIEHIKTELADIKKELIGLRQLLSQRPPQAQQRVNPVARVSLANSPMLGKAQAPVTIIEFSDYQCPFCRRFFQTTLPTLKAEYVDTGKVRYIFRDFPIDRIHPQARKAAEAAQCAGEQNKYWEMHDLLFQNQSALKVENLQAYARSLDLEATAFDACLEQGKYAAEINTDYADGSAAGITGTPSFFIGKTGPNETIEGTLIRGAQPLSVFRQEIDRLLEESK